MSLIDKEIETKWADFKVRFEKKYSDEIEETMRKELFVKTVVMVEEHNEKYKQGLVTSTMRINHFADRTPKEKQQWCGTKPPKT